MATMNFSIPDEIKDAFNTEFEGQNKSAIVAELLRKAVEDKRRRANMDQQFDALWPELLRQRSDGQALTDEEIRALRQEGRP